MDSHSHDDHHGHHHHHGHQPGDNLTFAFWINSGFALIELFGGLYTNSVAIMSDALHDFGDSLSIGLAFYFHKKSRKKRDANFSYGYKRFSLLGAFVNSIVLIVGSVFVIIEAVQRLRSPEDVNAKGMLLLALLGVVANSLALLRLRKGKSVNEQVISLHFIEDILGWVAVLIGSIVMLFTHMPILDPIMSLMISLFILYNVFKNLRHFFGIILQSVPANVNVDAIKTKLLSIPTIQDIHDVHVWSMDGEYNIMTIHVVLKKQLGPNETENIKKEIRHTLEHLNIQHLTIETEHEDQVCVLKNC
jgi:cobalt-zinc-cadmium efflux system protein